MWSITTYIFGCNEENKEEEDDNKNIDGQNATRYEEEEQTSEPNIETTCTNEMVSEWVWNKK